ncbi:MAG: translation initiation factor IF-3 [Saprospiraceae bacterium]
MLSRRNNNNRNRGREEEPKFRVNGNIRIPEIRLVGNNLGEVSKKVGETVESGVYQTRKVLQWASKSELDLVEISPKAKPPVCRLVDYSKFLYERKKKEKEIKSKAVKTVIKEIRFGPNTDDHDFEFKMRHAIGFLEDGAKVKAYVQFKGRTIVFKERGELLLLRFMSELEAYGAAEAMPRLEGRRMSVMISPKKRKKPAPIKKRKPRPQPKVEAKTEAKPQPKVEANKSKSE